MRRFSKKKIMTLTSIIMVLNLIFIFSAADQISLAESSESTLYVGGNGSGNYSSIRKAIEDAASGDTIFVYEGTYYETISIEKSINIVGDHKNFTIIDGGNNSNVLEIKSQGITLSSLTVQHSKKPTKEEKGYAGILIESDLITISNCNILHCAHGILVKTSNQNTIERCYFNDNYGGINIQYSNQNTIYSCEIKNSSEYYAIALTASSDNIVQSCKIHHNPVLGIVLSQSTDNIIHHNEFNSNVYAMRFFQTENNSCKNNTIYENNFIENTAIDNCKNDWNHSGKGNYWSEYSGSDANQDGIGDVAYLIPGGINKDFFPLMDSVIIETNESETNNGDPADSSSNIPPKASFSYVPKTPVINENIIFTDTSTDQDGIIRSWYWDFGDGNTSIIQHPHHSFSKEGSYNVSLEITDDNGLMDNYTTLITIKKNASNDSLTINYPEKNEVLNDLVYIYGNATSKSFEQIEVQIDDNGWKQATGVNPWNYSLDTTQYENGLHTIYVRGTMKNEEFVFSSIQVTFENNEQNETENINDSDRIENTSEKDISTEETSSISNTITFLILLSIITIIGGLIILFIAKI